MQFNIVILQKIRSKMISTLAANEFDIPTQYKLSTAVVDAPTFILSIVDRQNLKQGGVMKSCLEQSFDGQLKINQKNDILHIDATHMYLELNKEIVTEVHSINFIEKDHSPPLDESLYGKLLRSVVSHLEQSFYKNKLLSEVGITIGERKKKDDSIKIIFDEDKMDDFYAIIRNLERHPDFRLRLAVMKNIIFIMQDEVSYEEMTKTNKLISSFLSKLASTVRDHHVTFVLVTPMTIAVTTNPVKLKLEVNTPNGTIRLYNNTDVSWKPAIEGGKSLTIEILMDEMEEYLKGNKILHPPQKLEVSSVPKENMSKVVPFGKAWELPPTPLSLDKSCRKGLEVRQIATNVTGAPVYGYVHESTAYLDFHFLPFNRKVNNKHVKEIMSSVEENGVMGFVTVAITNVIDGVMRMYIVDGQHRYWAFRKLGLPILFTYTYAESKRQLVKLIAKLNTTSKSWSLKDYLYAWESVDADNYGTIAKCVNNTKMQITILLEAFSGLSRGLATEKFQKGTFEIADKEVGERHISYLLSLRRHISKSRNLYSALLTVFRKIDDYDNKVMYERLFLRNEILSVTTNESQEAIVEKLINIYYDRAA